MKKFFIIITLIFCIAGTAPLFSQGMPVIDAAHILESIYNGYQIYQSVQNTLQQLRYTYESVKAQIQMLQRFDYSSIGSFTQAVSFVDRQLSFFRNTENRLKNMRVRVGNKNYDLLSIYEVPGAATEKLWGDLTREMTVEERARAWSHYGLRPVNYMYVETWKARITDASKKLAGLADSVEENIETASREVDEITATSRETDSTVGLLQASIEMQGILFKQLTQMNYSLATMGQLMGDSEQSKIHVPDKMVASKDFLK